MLSHKLEIQCPSCPRLPGLVIVWIEISGGTAFEPCRSFGASQQSLRYSPSFSLLRGERDVIPDRGREQTIVRPGTETARRQRPRPAVRVGHRGRGSPLRAVAAGGARLRDRLMQSGQCGAHMPVTPAANVTCRAPASKHLFRHRPEFDALQKSEFGIKPNL